MKQEFVQELKNTVLDIVREVHVALPGKILSFDPGKQEARVKPAAKYRKPDGGLIDFPDISHVPVLFPQGMGRAATICWKLEPGDECLLVFMEQALDQWRTGAESRTDLRHDLTNAVAIPGLFAKPNPHAKRACENESIIIQRESVFVELFDKRIEIYSDGDICGKADANITLAAGVDVSISAKANITITAGADATITTAGDATITTAGDTTVTSLGDVAVDAGGDASVTAKGNVNVKGANINLN